MVKQRNVRILSAGAPKQGVRLCAEAHEAATGCAFEVEFATAPVIREQVGSGDAGADLIVAPVAAMTAFVDAGHIVEGSVVQLGYVEAGVAVRNGAAEPDLSSVDTLRKALLSADAVIFNRASSGQYIETMIEGLGIADQIASKTFRTDTGSQAMQRLADDTTERPIGFGQITEIKLKQDLGIHLVGPLPAEIGKRTRYSVGLSSQSATFEDAKSLLDFYASDEARTIFSDSGVN